MICKWHGMKGASNMRCEHCPFLDTCLDEEDEEEEKDDNIRKNYMA